PRASDLGDARHVRPRAVLVRCQQIQIPPLVAAAQRMWIDVMDVKHRQQGSGRRAGLAQPIALERRQQHGQGQGIALAARNVLAGWWSHQILTITSNMVDDKPMRHEKWNPASPHRLAAVALLRHGLARKKELADLLGVAPSAISYWAKVARLDATALRK